MALPNNPNNNSIGTRPSDRINSDPLSQQSLTFPSNSADVGEQPFTIFDIRHSIAGNAQSLGVIVLPFPKDLTVSYATDYQDMSIGLDSLADWIGLGKENSQALGSQAGEEMSARVVDGMLDINNSARLERERGAIVNPHMAALFKGVGFRTFNFQFDFQAKNQDESNTLRDILHTFKYYMHPSSPESGVNRRFLLYPQNFIIGFFTPTNEYLFRISTSALTGLQVQYNGSGVPAFFRDTGAPIDIRLNLQFKELEIMTKERIVQGY